MSERSQDLVTRGFEKVRAQVDRRTIGQGPALLGGVTAEARLELRRQPFGKIAGHIRRRASKVGGRQAPSLGVRQHRWRVALPREERRDGVSVEAARLPQRAHDLGARRLFAHKPGRRSFAPQRVINEARNRRPVARACKAVGEPPVLHCLGGRPATGLDVAENVDRGGDAGGGGHTPSCRKSPPDAKSPQGHCRRRRIKGRITKCEGGCLCR